MARGFTFLTFLLLAGIPGFGQIIAPGVGYPGGGYPGRPYPQGTPGHQAPDSRRDQAGTTFTGMLRSIGKNNVVVESDDKTITTISTVKSTKYIGVSGGSAQIGDFQPGDHVRIDANQVNNVYHASTMTMVRDGTMDEHAAASQAVNDTSRPLSSNSIGTSSANNPDGSSAGSDHDTPRLRQAASSPDSTTGSSSSSPSASSQNNDDPDRPRLHRAAGSSDGTPGAQITPGDTAPTSGSVSRPSGPSAPRDADDDGPPQLKRGSSTGGSTPSTNSDATVADARPSLQADVANGVTRTPPPPRVGAPADGDSSPNGQRMPASGDPVIDQAREEAFSFTETLPNYVVKQYTTRYAAQVARGSQTSWQALDHVTADVVAEDGTEKYKNILVNGQPPRVDVEKTGSWTRGEFSSLQLDVLSPITNARFHGKQATTIVSRAAFVYDFSVERPNSHWHIEAEGQTDQPAYTGSIWIDKENYRVLRIELSAQNLPGTFPLDTVESAVDYDYVVIGEGKYLLPVHSEALSCAHGASGCTRNVIEFRNYKKFAADSNITFDPEK
jgi:hypothetical protein